jgi:hypothetical protein
MFDIKKILTCGAMEPTIVNARPAVTVKRGEREGYPVALLVLKSSEVPEPVRRKKPVGTSAGAIARVGAIDNWSLPGVEEDCFSLSSLVG